MAYPVPFYCDFIFLAYGFKITELRQFSHIVNTMLQMSKIANSRNAWRKKATERADEIREFRKTQKRHLEKIAELKRQICELEMLVAEKK